MELELPLWQVRRIAYDEGEWHCALSRERELPDWLDAAVEARYSSRARTAVGFHRGSGIGPGSFASECSRCSPRA